MTNAPRLQGPGRQNAPEPLADLVQQLVNIRRQLNDVQSALLKSAGLQVEPDLLRVLGSLVVEGDLSVPNGSITNEALASPATFDRAGLGVGNFAVPAAVTGVPEATIGVPVGYSRAIVLSIATFSIWNSGASQYVSAGAKVDELNDANAPAVWCPTSALTRATGHATKTLTGLAGGSITVRGVLRAQTSAIPASVSSIAVLDAIAIFLR